MNRSRLSVGVSALSGAALLAASLALPSGAQSAVGPDPVQIQIVVKVDSPDRAAIDSLAASMDLRVDDALLASRGIYLVHAMDSKAEFDLKKARDLAKRIGERDEVVFAEVNEAILVDDTRQFSGWPYGAPAEHGEDAEQFTDQPAATTLELARAHALSVGDTTTVAVLDTGVDSAHPVLAGLVLPGWNYVGDDADTRDVALGVDSNDDGVVDDAVGHGTFVAGLVSLVAPSAKILPYRVLDSDGVGNVYLAYQAILDATASGADVINLSFGSPAKGSSHLLSDAIKSAQRAGVVVVAAAGNDGTNHQQYPAAQTEVLSVAALDGTALPAFSSRGKWVDVSAPGVGIVGPLPGGRYALWAGTSTAAPFVAGQVALMRSLAPSLSAKTLREAVDKTSRDLPKGSGGDPAPRSIDIVAALDYLAH